MSHPAIRSAMDACADLDAAAGKVGTDSPVHALSLVDYEPEAIRDYQQQLTSAREELDGAIAEAEAARVEQGEASSGEANAEATAATDRDLAELRAERDRLQQLIKEVDGLAAKLDELAVATGAAATDVARRPEVADAVRTVLGGSWVDDVLGAEELDRAEGVVHAAVGEIVRLCVENERQRNALTDQLEHNLASAESGGVGSGGAEAGMGGGAEAGVGSGAAEGGAVGGGGPHQAD
ncbi:hypothetical protein [Saccharothrix variisporea]|uniref:Uncharacterized protein n=1 Tax=Saccharothrix variisporea TaxID=543527 RepID=A0A495XBB5_9PSEU|nr:hypothetical protein [Saccharothrix variisporea]RKT71287.1 hypothetical protein DFJ66_4570 [Saccharothrix variisporea]